MQTQIEQTKVGRYYPELDLMKGYFIPGGFGENRHHSFDFVLYC